MSSVVLIDASWWFGGNKDRGIGQYLKYFFLHVFPVPSNKRIWLVPDSATEKQQQNFSKIFGGEKVFFPTTALLPRQWSSWEKVRRQKEVSHVFIPSPFERPWSILHLQNKLFEETKVEALVFDLLPLQYPQRILNTWSEVDQEEYRQRITLLERCTHLYTISPYSAAQMRQYLSFPLQRISVLEFGGKYDWVRPALSAWPFRRRTETRPFVLTISGGEWRKNLSGTLEYFARAFPKEIQLQVICRLSLRERFQVLWLALRLGILSRIRLCGYITEKQKWHKLAQADALLFLSRAEGLGIPLLEAQAAGVPRVIISRALEKAGHGTLCDDFYEVALT